MPNLGVHKLGQAFLLLLNLIVHKLGPSCPIVDQLAFTQLGHAQVVLEQLFNLGFNTRTDLYISVRSVEPICTYSKRYKPKTVIQSLPIEVFMYLCIPQLR